MAVKGISKSALLRASALLGTAGTAFAIATPAAAITQQQYFYNSTQGAPNQGCRLIVSLRITGTVNDTGTGQDQYALVARDPMGNEVGRSISSVAVGQILNTNQVIDIPNGNNGPRGTYTVDLYEYDGTNLVGSPLGTAIVPRNAPGLALQPPCRGYAASSLNADAGPDQTVNSNDTVTLDGGGTNDPDGDTFVYNWGQTTGPAVSLQQSNTQQPTFVAPVVQVPTVFTFQLIATDAVFLTDTDTVSITVNPPANTPPIVDAGPDQNVAGGDTVMLSATASDPDNDPLIQGWVQVSGPTVTLSNPSSLTPTFTAPARGINDQVLSFVFGADDGTVTTQDQVDITVAGNEAPVVAVSASPTSGGGNSQFTLDGSATSDPEGDQIFYFWTQTAGPSVTLSDPNAAATTFTAPQGSNTGGTTLTFQLLAADTFDESNAETISVTLQANGDPVADAGVDQDAQGSSTVTLDGSASSDPDGDALTYTWTQLSGPTVTLNDPNAVQPTFAAPASTGQAQTLEFQLTVDDGSSGSSGVPIDARIAGPTGTDSDQVVVTILANRPPVADAGTDQGPIDAGQTVTLDGTGSTDPDGDTLTYSWVQTSGPSVTLSDANAAMPTFTAPAANDTVTFELTVSDGAATSTDSIDVEVRAVGTVTIVQRITGTDTSVAFTSSLAALTGAIQTSNGVGQVSANNVVTGSYTVTAADLSAQGIAVTDITCSDDDSTGDVATRTATIDLAPGEEVTCTFTAANSREAAQVAIYNFLTARNALILANQPDLQRRLDRLSPNGGRRGGSVNAYGVNVPFSDKLPVEASVAPGQARLRSDLGMAIGGSNSRLIDVWGEAVFSSATIGTQDASFSIISFGADLKLSDNVLLGALAQFDSLSDKGPLEAGEAEGDGYLVGPYLTARLAEGFFVEARAGWGSSDNRVSPLTGQVDAFDTSRSLYSGSLIGQLGLGDKTVLRPEFTVRYLSEDQEAYTDSLGIAIPAQTVDQGDISFRPRLSHVLETGGGVAFRPYAQVEGIYTFGTEPDAALANLLPNNFADAFGNVRARLEGGVDLLGQGSFRATLSGFVDGIGADGFSNEGVHVGLSFGF